MIINRNIMNCIRTERKLWGNAINGCCRSCRCVAVAACCCFNGKGGIFMETFSYPRNVKNDERLWRSCCDCIILLKSLLDFPLSLSLPGWQFFRLHRQKSINDVVFLDSSLFVGVDFKTTLLTLFCDRSRWLSALCCFRISTFMSFRKLSLLSFLPGEVVVDDDDGRLSSISCITGSSGFPWSSSIPWSTWM